MILLFQFFSHSFDLCLLPFENFFDFLRFSQELIIIILQLLTTLSECLNQHFLFLVFVIHKGYNLFNLIHIVDFFIKGNVGNDRTVEVWFRLILDFVNIVDQLQDLFLLGHLGLHSFDFLENVVGQRLLVVLLFTGRINYIH